MQFVVAEFQKNTLNQAPLEGTHFFVERIVFEFHFPSRKLGRQVFNADLRTITDHDRTFNYVLQFADVAGPVVFLESGQSGG